MASRTLPNLGLKAFFAIGEDGWADEIDANFLKLSTLVQGAVLEIITSKPSLVSEGAIFLMSNAASSNANTVAVYDNAEWVHYAPLPGWTVYCVADDAFLTWNGTAWAELKMDHLRKLGELADESGLIEHNDDGEMVIRAIGTAASTDILTRGDGDARYATVGHTHPEVGVQTFNTRGGAVTLLSNDVTTALGFTPIATSVMLQALDGLSETTGLIEQTDDTTFAKRQIGAAADTDILDRLSADARFQSQSSKLNSIAALNLTGNAGKVIKVNIGETGFELATDIAGGGGGDGTWGAVTGDITDQTDLQLALLQKQGVDDTLTGLSALATTVGVIEQTSANTFAIRSIGVANATDLLSRAGGDARYQAIGSYQASSLNLTSLAGLNATPGLIEQTGAAAFTKRLIGVTNGTDIPTRAQADARFAALVHTHAITDVTGLQAALSGKQDITATLTALTALATTGNAGKAIRVNSGGNGFELVTTALGGTVWGNVTGTLTDQTDLNSALTALDSRLDVLEGADFPTAIGALDSRLDVIEGKGAINTQTGTSYTLVLGDADDYVECTNAAAITLNIPANASVAYPVGTVITIEQGGAGAITLTPDGSVTLQIAATHTPVTNGQHAVIQIKKKATDTWVVFGNLVAA